MLRKLLSFAIPNKWIIAGAAAVLVTSHTTAYIVGRHDADQSAIIAELRQENAALNGALDTWRRMIEDDARRAEEDRLERLAYQQRVSDLIETLSDPDAVCLPAVDTERLRDLWLGQ